MKTFGILGAGTWGTGLANMLENMGHHVSVWSPVKEEIEFITNTRTHLHLPGSVINSSIEFTTDIEATVKGKDYIIVATPSVFVRSTMEKIKGLVNNSQIIITVSKGIEKDTMLTMSEIIKDVVGEDFKVVCLSGPTHAEEVAKGLPTLIVAACEDIEIANQVRDEIYNDVLRVYSNTDIKGAEIAGALKNIMALACGMAEGMGYGDNLKAAIITRGLTEMVRLGEAIGCKKDTFYGLTGIGDIVVTATSNFSRNHNAGVLLGQGKSLKEAEKEIGMVIEGANALMAAKELAEKYKVEMPIVEGVYSVIYGGVDSKAAVTALFSRSPKVE
ncbi:MAG: NAD(P)-dependent glycerol-3-phosphate dehydrogenase [Bacilli bacterium]|nr:NAD(P)-dependent glycerol-3-phosphate dehydrogenase [Bacilli bacterium]